MNETETLLPKDLIARASLRGREYAWRISDIPEVIEAARSCGLVSIGGQLQFRFPDGSTCECYWVEVDTYKAMPTSFSTWAERVEKSAELARASYENLLASHDLIEEGRKAFSQVFSDFEQSGQDVSDAMCFVWYLKAESDEKQV
jgi:hypothetical protein